LCCSCPPGNDAQSLQVVAARHLAPRSQRDGSRILGKNEAACAADASREVVEAVVA